MLRYHVTLKTQFWPGGSLQTVSIMSNRTLAILLTKTKTDMRKAWWSILGL